jgi:hypothetical protein
MQAMSSPMESETVGYQNLPGLPNHALGYRRGRTARAETEKGKMKELIQSFLAAGLLFAIAYAMAVMIFCW